MCGLLDIDLERSPNLLSDSNEGECCREMKCVCVCVCVLIQLCMRYHVLCLYLYRTKHPSPNLHVNEWQG